MQKIRLFYSFDRDDFKILQSNCLRAFWPMSQEQYFPQIWDLCMNIFNSVNFHYRTNSVKLIAKFYSKFKNPHFQPIFGPLSQFLGQKIFSRICSSDMHKFTWVSCMMPEFRKKLSIPFQENAWTDKGYANPFYRTLIATTRDPKNVSTMQSEVIL